jgi:hypothetical protein
MLKVDIFQDGRFIGMLRVKDRWHGIIPIDEDEIKDEIEQRLHTLRKAKYTIAFA